jgi:hypothetical protein
MNAVKIKDQIFHPAVLRLEQGGLAPQFSIVLPEDAAELSADPSRNHFFVVLLSDVCVQSIRDMRKLAEKEHREEDGA